jgi:hypothetical protein
VPAIFSESGAPSGERKKVQRYWNKKSLAVGYTPADASITIRELYFDGKTLRAHSWRRDTPAKFLDNNGTYQRRFHRSFVRSKIRSILANYLGNPKLPAPRHLRALMQIMRSREYK